MVDAHKDSSEVSVFRDEAKFHSVHAFHASKGRIGPPKFQTCGNAIAAAEMSSDTDVST